MYAVPTLACKKSYTTQRIHAVTYTYLKQTAL